MKGFKRHRLLCLNDEATPILEGLTPVKIGAAIIKTGSHVGTAMMLRENLGYSVPNLPGSQLNIQSRDTFKDTTMALPPFS